MSIVEKLQAAIQIQTVSYVEEEREDKASFDAFLAFLEEAFPLVHQHGTRTLIHKHAPLFVYTPKNPKASYLFLAHFDVVPTGDPQAWTHPPFAGTLEDGVLWGRGSLDCKHQLIALMEALESLLAQGKAIQSKLSFAFGCDEEVGGMRGAKAIAAYLREKGERFDLILDEGGVVAMDMIPGVRRPMAVIGMAEKGSTQLVIDLKSKGGHSSMPPNETALTQAADIVSSLAKHPMKARLTPTVKAMFEQLSEEHPQGFLLKRIGGLFPLVSKILEKSPTMNALVRTTLVATLLEAGDAPNALPQTASLCINARILQGDTVSDVLAHIAQVTGLSQAQIQCVQRNAPSRAAAPEGAGFSLLTQLIGHFYPKAKALPYLMAGATDARHYDDLSDQVFRFTPLPLTQALLDTIHAYDERIEVSALEGMQAFYEALFLS